MPKKKASGTSENCKKIRPALTPEARENQLISMAVDLVEQRLLDGTASSQETTHFLKLGSMKNRLEMEKIKRENELLEAKVENLKSQAREEELFTKVIDAMRRYSGEGGDIEDEDDEW